MSIFANQDPNGNSIFTPQGLGAYSAGADLGNRLRVSAPNSLFSWKQDVSQHTDQIIVTGANGGTQSYNSTSAKTTLNVTTNANARTILQSILPMTFDTALPLIWHGSAVLGTGQANTQRNVGLMDATDGTFGGISVRKNGAFWQMNGTGMKVVVRSNVTGSIAEVSVAQALWSIDKLNGAGPSGLNIDFSRIQNFVVDIHWNSGTIRFGIMNDGNIIYCHQYNAANVISNNGLATSLLYPTFEIVNNGTAPSGSASMDVMSSAVIGESALAAPAPPSPNKYIISAPSFLQPSYLTGGVTDAMCVVGSATKKVIVTGARALAWNNSAVGSGIAQSPGFYPWQCKKRTTLNTGANNPITPQPLDSNVAAATCSAFYYTTKPTTLGTGFIICKTWWDNGNNGATGSGDLLPDGMEIVLNGVNEMFCIAGNDSSIPTAGGAQSYIDAAIFVREE